MHRNPIPCVALAALLTACQSTSAPMSSVSTYLDAGTATAIASDMAGKFEEQVGPANTTIALRSDGSPFGDALHASLKGKGYAVMLEPPGKSPGAVTPLAYVIDNFEGNVMVRLSTSSLNLTRVYRRSAAGVDPASPLSIMERGGERS